MNTSKEGAFAMSVERQVEIMEAQLGAFDSLLEKMSYMSFAFDPDPEFTKEARDIVRGNISKSLKQAGE
jgi:hypothetical protein